MNTKCDCGRPKAPGDFLCYGCRALLADPNTDDLCPHCDGDGWGIVGVDWNCEDAINGPYDGEIQQCPWCRGSGKAEDVSVW